MDMKSLKLILLIALFLSGLTACANTPEESPTEKELIEYSEMAMDAGFDTIYAYSEFGYDKAVLEDHYTLGVNMFSSYNKLFDIYNDYEGVANLKTINDNAGIQPVEVDQEIIDMLHQAKEIYDISNGAFDITMGAVLKIWHEYREAGIALNEKEELAPVPSQEELDAVSMCRGWDKVEIDDENNTVYINDPCVSLDVGGIAKGYAAEKIAQAIEKNDVVYGNINAGRNIRTMKVKPNDVPWRIGIVNPTGEGSIVVVDSHEECSYVTSGDYERFYVGEDGYRYHHIVSSETLKPENLYRSVSIVTLDSGAADALSTTLFSISVEEGKKVLEKYKEITGQDANAIWIMDKDKSQGQKGKEIDDLLITYTDAMEDRLIWAHY